MCSIKLVKQQGCYANFKKTLLAPPLIIIYKSFIKPHQDYGDVIYDQSYKVYFHQKLEYIQYNYEPVIKGAERETSREKLYH